MCRARGRPANPSTYAGPIPEGDTIWKTARRLQPALEGKVVRRFEATRLLKPLPQPGETIEGVWARGKFLLVEFSGGQILETHMKMTGSWHLYRSGERWRKAPSTARAVIETTEDWIAACFSAPHVQLVPTASEAMLASDRLGPDLCSSRPDIDTAVQRFGDFAADDTEIGVALLDQRISSGIGNVYKSEVLHALGVDPRTPSAAVPEQTKRELLQRAHQLLRANLGSGGRITVAGVPGGLAVYRRAGKPCPRCRGTIVRIVQGEHSRSTYFCGDCQRR